MSTLYDTSFGPGIPLGSSLVPGSAIQGALNANLLTGGFLTVPTLADRNAIPVDVAEGLKLDGLSSGRRQVGMVVTVAETGERFELKIAGFSTLSAADKLSALADNANWNEFKTPVNGEYLPALESNPDEFSVNNVTYFLNKISVPYASDDDDAVNVKYAVNSFLRADVQSNGTYVVGNDIFSNNSMTATKFIGDGSKLTNLPVQSFDTSSLAKLSGGNNFVGAQNITLAGADKTVTLYHDGLYIDSYNQNLGGGVNVRLIEVQDASGNPSLSLSLEADHVQVLNDPTLAMDIATKQYVDQALGNTAIYARLDQGNTFIGDQYIQDGDNQAFLTAHEITSANDAGSTSLQADKLLFYHDGVLATMNAIADPSVVSGAIIVTNSKVQAPYFIGDGSQLTNLPTGGTRIANAAVFTATTSGAQTIAIGAAATGLISVTLLEAGSTTYTRLVWEGFCTINGTNLNITADPQIQPNDKILIKYTL